MPVGAATTSGGAPLPSGALTRRDGWAWRFASTARDEYDGAQAQYRDMDAGKNVTVTAGGSKRKKLRRIYANRADAEAAAQGEASKRKRGAFTFEYERSEEHTSELQSLMRNSYAVFCLKKKKTKI